MSAASSLPAAAVALAIPLSMISLATRITLAAALNLAFALGAVGLSGFKPKGRLRG
jgi:hypothetical protein